MSYDPSEYKADEFVDVDFEELRRMEGEAGHCSCRCMGECPLEKDSNALCTADELRDALRKHSAFNLYKLWKRRAERLEAKLEQLRATCSN